MRRALVVGIDAYPKAPLAGCVNDAERIAELLSHHHDGAPNFECKRLLAPAGSSATVDRSLLRRSVEELFSHEADVALLYFSGHGTVNNLGGFLVTQDAQKYDEGVSMADILYLANGARVREVVIIVDCCHSGALGAIPQIGNEQAILREGVSILTASRASQTAVEAGGGGVFTTLVRDALDGGAADVAGNVTVAAVYAYVDQALGAWDQRPLFKSHVSKLIPLRRCLAAVDLSILRLLPRYFPRPDDPFRLNPSYEPTSEDHIRAHGAIFKHLQCLRDARLLVPVGADHMYDAAMGSKTCRLTPLGRFYWTLANGGKL